MRRGYINIYLMLVILVLLASLGSLSSILVSNFRALRNQENAFALEYLAEAGIEFGKDSIKNIPGYYTDGSPRTPLKTWLIEESVGSTMNFKNGGVKIICPSGRGELYAVGFFGVDILTSSGYAFLKIKFEEEPLRVIEWTKF
ncbi:MAG: hypothetical protein WC901_02185 [Candidatus Margulisiibacteriota bacterium]